MDIILNLKALQEILNELNEALYVQGRMLQNLAAEMAEIRAERMESPSKNRPISLVRSHETH